MLNVKLIAYTPDPEKVIAAAAKICYSASDAETIMEGLTPEKTDRFLGMLTDMGHESPIEHASFTFAIEGVSRSLLAQLTRHRIASYSVQSQRYVKLKEGVFAFVTPPEIARDPVANEKYQQAMADCHRNYLELADALQARHTAELMEQGLTPKEVLENTLKDAVVLDLTGCVTEDILFYVSKGSPVFAMTGSKNAILVVGYTGNNINYYDPELNRICTTTFEKADEMFHSGGNKFITYLWR